MVKSFFFCVNYFGTPPHMIKTSCAKFRRQNHPNNTLSPTWAAFLSQKHLILHDLFLTPPISTLASCERPYPTHLTTSDRLSDWTRGFDESFSVNSMPRVPKMCTKNLFVFVVSGVWESSTPQNKPIAVFCHRGHFCATKGGSVTPVSLADTLECFNNSNSFLL